MSQLPPQQPFGFPPPAPGDLPAKPQPWPAPPLPPKPASSKTLLLVILGVGAVAAVCVVGILVALLLPAFMSVREASARAQSLNNLKQIGLALHSYHDTYKSLPAAFVPDAEGKPMTSWRTSILPFIEQESLFNNYDFNVPWNQGPNSVIRQARIPDYQSPRGNVIGTNRTSYVVVTSQREAMEPSYQQSTMFPGGRWTGLGDVLDGLSITIAVVEIENSDIEWSEPRDIDIDSLSTDPSAPNSINLEGGALVVFGDGAARQLPPGTTVETLKAMLTRNAREIVPEF